MNTRLYKNLKIIIYIISFINIIFGKLMFDISSLEYLGSTVFLLPAIFLCLLFFFHFRYYTNTFVKVRFHTQRKYMISHYKSIYKECILFASLQFILAIIFDLNIYSFENAISAFLIYLLIISTYLVLGSIYMTCFVIKERFGLCFILDMIFILIYKFYVTWWLQYGYYILDFKGIDQNINLIIFNILIIGSSILINMKKKYFIRSINQNILLILGYSLLEFLSTYYLSSYTVNYSNFSFHTLELLNNSEIIISLLLWILPKIFIICILFKKIYDDYKSHLIFYIVRINNKKLWLNQLYIQCIRICFICTFVKVIITIFIYQRFDMSVLYSAILYFLYLLFHLSILFVLYLFFKDESLLNYYLFIYVLLIVMGYITQMFDFILISHHVFIYVFILLLGYLISVYLINHDEYYG